MISEIKAKELVEKFQSELRGALYSLGNTVSAKSCALICVQELIDNYSRYKGMHDQELFSAELVYWQQVKSEIEAL